MSDEQKVAKVSVSVHEVVFRTLSQNRDRNFFFFLHLQVTGHTTNCHITIIYIKKKHLAE